MVHKFRSAIGKSKLIRDGEKVLVAFSGGANSSALLHLIQDVIIFHSMTINFLIVQVYCKKFHI